MKVWFQNRRTKNKRETTEGEGGVGEGGEHRGRDENGADGSSGNGGNEDEELDIIDYDDEEDYVDQLKMRHAAALAAINQSNRHQSINSHSPGRQSPPLPLPLTRDLKDYEMKESQKSPPPSLFTSLPKQSSPPLPSPTGSSAVNLAMTSSEAVATARPQQLTASTHPLAAVHALTLRADNQAAGSHQQAVSSLAANNKTAFSLSGSSQPALIQPLNSQASGSLAAGGGESLPQGLNLAAARSLPNSLHSIWTLIPKSTSSEKI